MDLNHIIIDNITGKYIPCTFSYKSFNRAYKRNHGMII